MAKKQAVLSLSGGMDSSTVLLHLLAEGYEVTALSFDYGQKHNVELERAAELIEYLDRNGHPVKYQRITLQGLVSLLNSNLVFFSKKCNSEWQFLQSLIHFTSSFSS